MAEANLLEQKINTSAGLENPEETLARARELTANATDVPISTETLQEQPDFNIPETTPNVEADSSIEQFGSLAAQQQQQFTRELTEEAAARGEATGQSFEDLLATFETGVGEQESQFRAEQEFGVSAKRDELNRINNELLQEQVRSRRKIESLRENVGGGLASGVEAEVARERRESASVQADLAIVQMAAQGSFDSAQRLANQKAGIVFEQSQQALDTRKFIFEQNKDLWTTSEARLFNAKQSQLENNLARERADFETLQDVKLSAMQMAQINGAPTSVLRSIQTANTPEEVISVGGQWGSVDMLERSYRRQQIATSRTNQLLSLAAAGDQSAITELGFDPSVEPEALDPTTKRQFTEVRTATNDLLRMATDYKNLVEREGFTNEIFGDSAVLGQVNSLRAQMTATYKDAKKLGTLDQGLIDLMEQVLGDKPTSSLIGIGPEASIFGNLTGRQSNKITATMDELIKQTQIENARVSHALGLDPWSDPLNLDAAEPAGGNVTSSNPLGI